LVEAMDMARKGDVSSTLCIAYVEKLVIVGFKVFLVDTTSRETQIEIWEDDTQEPVEDVAVT